VKFLDIIADFAATTDASTTSGDLYLFVDSATGEVRVIDHDNLPSGGINNDSEDTTPDLGGPLDVQTHEIVSSGVNDIDLHSANAIILELGDAAGVEKVSIRDSGAVEVATIDSDGNIAGNNLSGTNTGNEAAASTTVAGVVEIATSAETDTGTDATRAVSPDGLAGSIHGEKSWCMAIFDSATDCATGNGTIGFVVPAGMNNMDLVDVTAAVTGTLGTGGTMDVMVRRQRAAATADMLSVAVTLGPTEWHISDGTINTANDDLATGDRIFIDVDAVHSTTAAKGLSVTLTARVP
jgi:hypothetical protein